MLRRMRTRILFVFCHRDRGKLWQNEDVENSDIPTIEHS